MVPKRPREEPITLSFASRSPWNTFPREVHMYLARTQINDGETTESLVDGHDQPKIYTIRDHALEVLMHPSVLELHASESCPYSTWRRTAVALGSASTVLTEIGDGGCIPGYGVKVRTRLKSCLCSRIRFVMFIAIFLLRYGAQYLAVLTLLYYMNPYIMLFGVAVQMPPSGNCGACVHTDLCSVFCRKGSDFLTIKEADFVGI